MMRLADIEAHITGMGELLDIVGATRSLAGMRLQEAQRMLPGIRRYSDSLAGGIADTLSLIPAQDPQRPAPGGGKALVLCTAEHGFAGGFNRRLAEAALEVLQPGDLLFALGTRGTALLVEEETTPAWTQPMATRCAGAPATVERLTQELYRRIAAGEISRIEVMFARHHQVGAANIEQRLLLPLDLDALRPRQPRQRPLHNLDPVALQERLIAEYVFALLTEAAVESIASENAARLAAMASAHDNVSKKLQQLRQFARQARQSEITSEIIELVAGAQALAGGKAQL